MGCEAFQPSHHILLILPLAPNRTTCWCVGRWLCSPHPAVGESEEKRRTYFSCPWCCAPSPWGPQDLPQEKRSQNRNRNTVSWCENKGESARQGAREGQQGKGLVRVSHMTPGKEHRLRVMEPLAHHLPRPGFVSVAHFHRHTPPCAGFGAPGPQVLSTPRLPESPLHWPWDTLGIVMRGPFCQIPRCPVPGNHFRWVAAWRVGRGGAWAQRAWGAPSTGAFFRPQPRELSKRRGLTSHHIHATMPSGG